MLLEDISEIKWVENYSRTREFVPLLFSSSFDSRKVSSSRTLTVLPLTLSVIGWDSLTSQLEKEEFDGVGLTPFPVQQRPPPKSFPKGLAVEGEDLVRPTRKEALATSCSTSQGRQGWSPVRLQSSPPRGNLCSCSLSIRRPTDLLRPAVRCPTKRYNTKLREGRGFTIDELKAAGIRRKEALSIGIPVDHRRRNKSEEGLKLNKERLEAYKTRLVLFPRKAGKEKKGDTAVSITVSEGANRILNRFFIFAERRPRSRLHPIQHRHFPHPLWYHPRSSTCHHCRRARSQGFRCPPNRPFRRSIGRCPIRATKEEGRRGGSQEEVERFSLRISIVGRGLEWGRRAVQRGSRRSSTGLCDLSLQNMGFLHTRILVHYFALPVVVIAIWDRSARLKVMPSAGKARRRE